MAHYRAVERKDGTAWEVRWREGAAFKQRTFSTEGAAQEFVVELKLTRRDTGSTAHLARLGKKFREVAEDSMAASAGRLKPKTARGYADAYRLHIYPTFGERRINSITSMEVERWVAEMRTRVSPATGRPYAAASLHGAFVAMSKVFAYAMKHRLIAANPCTVVDKPRLVRDEPVFLAPEEVAAIAAELDTAHPWGLVVRFAAYTGVRAGELAALRVRDVNLLRRHVEVRRAMTREGGAWVATTPKSARSVRDVPLPGFLVEAMRAYLAEHPWRADPNAPLWPSRKRGGHGASRGTLDWSAQFNPGSVYQHHFQPALVRLGIRAARWHDLRHYYASACAAQGIDIRKVSRWMGHANINTTDTIYTHLFHDSAAEDMTRLDALAWGAGGGDPPAVRVTRL